MDLHGFLNRLRSLHGIDEPDLPDLPPEKTAMFLRDPVRFLMRADDDTAEMIWRVIQARQRPETTTAKAPTT